MSLKIIWAPRARVEYAELLEYVEKNYGIESALELLDKVEQLVEEISNHPELFKASHFNDSRKAVVTKQTSLIYRKKNNRIELISFWDNRQDPRKEKDLTK